MTHQVSQTICVQGLSKPHLHLTYFDLGLTTAPSRGPAMNTEALFLLPLSKSICELLHAPLSFTHPQTSVTTSKLNCLLKGRRKKRLNKISSNRSRFGSLREPDDVVRCKDSAITILNHVQMSEDDRQREK